MNPAADPQEVKDVQGDERWISLHNRFLTEAKEKEPEVVLIGDSLVMGIQRTELWSRMFEPLHCLNFGIGGDQTQNVLWRIEHGELECMEPKIVVVMVGTNNYDHTAEQVAEGIIEITKSIHVRQRNASVIVMGLPPRGENPNPLRRKAAAINCILEKQLKNYPYAIFIDIDPSIFVNDVSKRISHSDMYDFLHLTTQGYQKICDPLLEEIQNILHTFVKVENTSVSMASSVSEVEEDS